MASKITTITRDVPSRALRALEEQLGGEIVRPTDPEYDGARKVWNASVDRYPALIVRPRDTNDVIRAVEFAQTHDLPIAVRGGGHSPAGYGTVDDGLVVDLVNMQQLTIDPATRIASAGPGVTWGAFAARAHADGLATPGPDVASVGVAGSAFSGGFGWLSRKYGMTVDNLVAAEVVTADGQLGTTTEDDHSDLFWALRGGGGNFGIATRVDLALHPVDTVVAGILVYPAERAVLRDYADVAAAAPDELGTITFVMHAPPLPFIPAESHGALVHMIFPCYAGDPAASEQAYAPLRQLGGQKPIADTIGPMPYPGLFELTKTGIARKPQSIRAGLMSKLDNAAIDLVLDGVSNATSPFSMVMLRVLGGEIARVPAEDTAFSHRDKPIYFAVTAAWEDERDPMAERHIAWAESLWRALEPGVGGAYAGFMGDEGPERVRAAYAPANYNRLAEVKRQYDPDNLFNLNANIAPA
jgi:FAD/FMN-containing dehydrogenase